MRDIKVFSILCLLSLISCVSSSSIDLLGVHMPSIQVGIDNNGQFSQREGRVYSVGEKMDVKLKVVGLKVIEGNVKLNVDLVLKQEGFILGLVPNIFRREGLQKESNPNSQGVGEADVELTITPPDEFVGDFIAQITVKDQQADNRLFTFEIPFTVQKK